MPRQAWTAEGGTSYGHGCHPRGPGISLKTMTARIRDRAIRRAGDLRQCARTGLAGVLGGALGDVKLQLQRAISGQLPN
jgi:hypothetical protein